MFVNHAAFEEGMRHQRITSYTIIPRQSSEQEDYQVLAENIPSSFEEDLSMIQNKEEIPFWIAEKGKAWAKLAKLKVNTPQLLFALSGNPAAKSESNGDNTFELFDDFEDFTKLLYGTTLVESGNNGCHDVAVKGDYAYVPGVWVDKLFVIDISDPESPSLTATLTDGSSRLDGIHDIVIDGNYAYVTCMNRDSIVAIDISTPASPSIVGEVIDSTKMDSVPALHKSGDYIYAGHYADGTCNYFSIIDASDPTNLSIIGSVQDAKLDGARGIEVIGNYAYVVCRNSGRLVVIDVSNKNSPSIVGDVQLTTTAGAKLLNIRCSGNNAFVTNFVDAKLEVVDISNPASPTDVTDISVGSSANYIEIYDDYAYISDGVGDKIIVIDISDPTNLSQFCELYHADLEYACGLKKVGAHLFCSARDGVDSAIVVLGTMTDWSVQPTTARSIEQAKGGTYSAKLHDTGTALGDWGKLEKPNFDFQCGVLDFDFYRTPSSVLHAGFELQDGSTEVFRMVIVPISEKLQYYDGAAWQDYSLGAANATGNAWEKHSYAFEESSSALKATVGGNYLGTGGKANAGTIDTLFFSSEYSVATGVFGYVDNIRLRKYASPEPLIIKRRTSGKADVIKAIVSGLVP